VLWRAAKDSNVVKGPCDKLGGILVLSDSIVFLCNYPSAVSYCTATVPLPCDCITLASVLSSQCPPIEASSIDRTQHSRFHLREDPSLETLWLKNVRTIDKVQITDCSFTAPSSKTFGDESSCVVSPPFTVCYRAFWFDL
jgi:hypothetical protein